MGDEVIAYDEETGQTGEYTVTDTIQHEDESIAYVTINGEEIETTPWHLFLTQDGWVEAGDLQEGDAIVSLGGVYSTVDSVIIENTVQTMYDLTVEDVHNFAVGDGDWVVHNVECVRFLTPDRSDAYNPSLTQVSNGEQVLKDVPDPDLYNRFFAGNQLYTTVVGFDGNVSTMSLQEARDSILANRVFSLHGITWDPNNVQTLVNLHATGSLVNVTTGSQSSPFISLSDNLLNLINTQDPSVREIIDNLATHIDIFDIPENQLFTPTIGPRVAEGEVLFFGFGISQYQMYDNPAPNIFNGNLYP